MTPLFIASRSDKPNQFSLLSVRNTHSRCLSVFSPFPLLAHPFTPQEREGPKPMGEEEKKPAAEEKKEEEPQAAAGEDGKKEEKKSEEPPPPPPPKEIVLKVFMHCEGCARKVRRCLKGFEGVEEVITDCRSSRVVVRGEKADPVKVFERVQRKSHRQVQLISPVPTPQPPEPEKPAEKEVVKPEEKKEPAVITVVLGVYMHCEACAQEIKRRIMRMKGVVSAEAELKSSQVMVKGTFEPEKLTEYVLKRAGKHATIIKVEPEKKEEEKPKDDKEEKKKAAEEGEKEPKKGEETTNENKDGGGGGGGGGGGESQAAAAAEEPKMELKRNEMYYYYPQNYQLYPQRFVQEMNAYPPQMFSDENPNACSVM